MSIPSVGAVGFTPFTPPTMSGSSVAGSSVGGSTAAGLSGLSGNDATGASSSGGGADFAQLLSHGLQSLQGLHTQTESLATKAATGDLTAIHDYTITATEASVATQLTTAVRNKALESFNEIMRMSV